jgi:hypothetical protein
MIQLVKNTKKAHLKSNRSLEAKRPEKMFHFMLDF